MLVPSTGNRPNAAIAVIRITPAVESELRERHGLTAGLVRQVLIYRRDVEKRWDDNPANGGPRLVALARAPDSRQIIAWLVPLDDGEWQLKSARYV